MFIKKGKKKKLFKHLYIALLNLKFDQNILPTIFITEMIERIRPNFKLTKYFPNKRGKICPRVVRNSQTYALAYH
jgi:DNA-directed RNA polymerase subunit H (RpoH/RPB5)